MTLILQIGGAPTNQHIRPKVDPKKTKQTEPILRLVPYGPSNYITHQFILELRISQVFLRPGAQRDYPDGEMDILLWQ